MEKQVYISEVEREKCRKVAEAYSELYEEDDILVLDAGRYGFVKLQYYRPSVGFDGVTTFTDSQKLFDSLWEEWRNTQLLMFVKGTPMAEMDYEEMLKSMPKEKQRELLEKRNYFAQKAGIM
ncbi:MAG: hypothetical protein Q4D94_05680 [Bacillota bacterium]|nr:hypothetical protein [Bacillota bacterium]